MEGVVYIAHGSRSAAGNQVFIEFIHKVMDQSGLAIQAYGFLENAQPSILEAIEQCILLGAKQITVIPVLLLPGIHVTVDIPAVISKAKVLYPELVFRYGTTIGTDNIIVEILADCLAESGFTGNAGEAVLLVGHGSREREAMEGMERLAAKLWGKLGRKIETGYLTARPGYLEKAEEMVSGHAAKLYVMPFLLFAGGFRVKIEDAFSRLGASFEKEVKVCRPVGFDEKLIPLIVKKADEAKAMESL